LEGYDAGKIFDLAGQKHYIIGRNAEGSQASVKLDSRDTYVSRNHCIVEIKQSSCYIIDNCSANGTMIKKNGDTHFQIVKGIYEIDGGDILCIGNTIIKIRVNRIDKEIPKRHCLQCGVELDSIQSSQIKRIPSTNWEFYCDNCKSTNVKYQNNAEHDANAEDNINDRMSQIKFQCLQCGKDVSHLANKDGMAYELYYIASYLCKDCVDKICEVDSNSCINGVGKIYRDEIKDYLMLCELGRGGMGIVYKGWQPSTGRIVTIKKMNPEVKKDHYTFECFKREIKVQSTLPPGNIIAIFGQGYLKNTQEFYLISEYVNGLNANDLLCKYGGPLPEKVIIKIACDVLTALEVIEEKGMVHRDIKPSNILVTRFGDNFYHIFSNRKPLYTLDEISNKDILAKLSDFGIAKPLKHVTLTPTDMSSVGTPLFMSPEQILNYKYVKPSADIYSLGVTLYYLATAGLPFEYDHSLRQEPNTPLILKIFEDKRIPIRERNASVSSHFAEVIDSTLKRDIEKRNYTSARDLKKVLQQI
jgi:serine/threonine-protein kinase